MLGWVQSHVCVYIAPALTPAGCSGKGGGVLGGRHTPLSVPGALLAPLAPDPAVAFVGLDPHSRLVPGGGLQRRQRQETRVLEGLCLALLQGQVCQQVAEAEATSGIMWAQLQTPPSPGLCYPPAPTPRCGCILRSEAGPLPPRSGPSFRPRGRERERERTWGGTQDHTSCNAPCDIEAQKP